MRNHFLYVITLLLPGLALGDGILEERRERAQQNMEERQRAFELIEEEEDVEESIEALGPVAIHPYERIKPERFNSLFEEMGSGN